MKKNGFFGLLVILLVFCFFSCGGDDDPEIYTVTIGSLTNANGSIITASPTSGVKGTEITLTISESYTYFLKSGTLKYGTTIVSESELKFNLPAENVIITAEFDSSLVGSWAETWEGGLPGRVFTFFGNGIFAFTHPNMGSGLFIAKGQWILQKNSVKLIITHVNGLGVSTINEFIENDELEQYDENCSIEIVSSNSIKFNDLGYESILTFVEND